MTCNHHCEPDDYSFPAPILLLDGWMDTETSTVVQKGQPSLHRLGKRGAVVISVMHKPNLCQLDAGIHRIALN
jgi:hypothetical protein